VESTAPVREGEGGVSTFIKQGVSYTVLSPVINNLECITIQLKLKSNKTITINNVYHPPDPTLFEDDYRQLLSFRNSFLVRDLNAHDHMFGSNSSSQRGRLLVGLLDELSSSCLSTGEGTHITYHGNLTPLDLSFVSSNLALECDWIVLDDPLGSDHLPCITSFQDNVSVESSTAERWSYVRADWVAFKGDCLLEITDDIVEPLDPIASYDRLLSTLVNISRRHIPRSRNKRVGVKKVLYWNNDCEVAIKARNKAQNRMLAT